VLTAEQVAIVKGLLARGEKQSDIAAFFGSNGGRIAEIHTGQKHSDVKPAPPKDLPTQAQLVPYGHIALVVLKAIDVAMIGLQSARAKFLEEIEHERERFEAIESARKARRAKR
jgi:hypothetical protein